MSTTCDKCPKCSALLELCVGVYPFSIDHLICSKCDSTYTIENEPTDFLSDKYNGFDFESDREHAPIVLPCPFCGSKDITIVEKERTKMGVKNKCTYCYCRMCGAKGPWRYSNDDTEEVVINRCITR